jgi:hypothetical protein
MHSKLYANAATVLRGAVVSIAGSAALAALMLGDPAAANSFTNGNFAMNGSPGQLGYNTTITGWYTLPPDSSYLFLFQSGTADTTGSNGEYGNLQLWGTNNGGLNVIPPPPGGGSYFVGEDGDFQTAPLDQDITGLTIGKTYTVSFDYAFAQQVGFNGDTLQNWCVDLGSSAEQCTPTDGNPSHGFTGWFDDSFSFVATSSDETLSFLAYGNLPVPPFALLADVTFTPDSVPEPAPWTILAAGLGGLIFLARRRRAARS